MSNETLDDILDDIKNLADDLGERSSSTVDDLREYLEIARRTLRDALTMVEDDDPEDDDPLADSRAADAGDINARALNEHLRDIMGRYP